jgi:hypothetical protein
MNIDVMDAAPASVEADLLALATGGSRLQDLDTLFESRAATASGCSSSSRRAWPGMPARAARP